MLKRVVYQQVQRPFSGQKKQGEPISSCKPTITKRQSNKELVSGDTLCKLHIRSSLLQPSTSFCLDWTKYFINHLSLIMEENLWLMNLTIFPWIDLCRCCYHHGPCVLVYYSPISTECASSTELGEILALHFLFCFLRKQTAALVNMSSSSIFILHANNWIMTLRHSFYAMWSTNLWTDQKWNIVYFEVVSS